MLYRVEMCSASCFGGNCMMYQGSVIEYWNCKPCLQDWKLLYNGGDERELWRFQGK